MGTRGPAAKYMHHDQNSIYIDRIKLALVLKRDFGEAKALQRLLAFSDFCAGVVGSISSRTARRYLSGKVANVGAWSFSRLKEADALALWGYDKAARPTIFSEVGYDFPGSIGEDSYSDYGPVSFPIGGQFMLDVNGSGPRITIEDNLPDGKGNRKAGPFGLVDVRIEHCSIRTSDNQPYDKPRNYIRVSYPDDAGQTWVKPGVVNLMYVESEQKFALVSTIRPAVRKIAVEAIRGFPDKWDKNIVVNGQELSGAMFAAVREANEEGGVMLKSDDGKLAIFEMSRNFADTGKLSDRVVFFLSSFETIGTSWKAAEPWQLGLVLVDPIIFLRKCAIGGGTLQKGYEFRSRFEGSSKALYDPQHIEIEDMFTLLAGNLAIQALCGDLGDQPAMQAVAKKVRASFKRQAIS